MSEEIELEPTKPDDELAVDKLFIDTVSFCNNKVPPTPGPAPTTITEFVLVDEDGEAETVFDDELPVKLFNAADEPC